MQSKFIEIARGEFLRMKNIYSKLSEKAFITIITIIFLIITFFLIRSIFLLIVYGIILAYFLNPLFLFYSKKMKNEKLSSLLSLGTVTIFILIPLSLLSYFLILNLIKIVIKYKIYIENPTLLNTIVNEFLVKVTNSNILNSIDFSELLKTLVIFIVNLSKNFFSGIPKTIISFLIILFITYYLLVYNKSIFKNINEYLPLSLKKQNEIVNNIKKNLKVLVRGYFLTGLIQTLVALLGYIIFGVPNLLIVTFLTLIISLIPYLGTPLVWVPLSLFMIINGNEIGGIGLLIYGTLLITMVDNFVRPILMSNKETISPPLVFIGFVGGMITFGIGGIILGPLIISITAILLRYLKEAYVIKKNKL